MSAPTHVTETLNDRRKTRELAEARQNGAVAPEVDVKTGTMINPHNPEFITRRPWYLGGNDEGPSLDHQADQRTEADRVELSMASADKLVQENRDKLKHSNRSGKLRKGMWVEALKKNKKPYLICQVVKVYKRGNEFDLQFEDGFLEQKVKFRQSSSSALFPNKNPRIRITKAGNRSFTVDHSKYGKETFDSKRDKYHGYEASSTQHTKMMEEKYSKRDAIRRKLKTQQQHDKTDATSNEKDQASRSKTNNNINVNSDSDTDYDSDEGSDSDDEFVQRDEDATTFQSRLARQGGVGGAQMKVTARNLRIREDTAKYLRNLDLNSAYYDPKSRSMRDNPNADVNPDELQFAGDNFARISGDAVGLAKTQLFAWDASGRGGAEVHPQANPSQAELSKKKFDDKSDHLKEEKKRTVLEKYGGAKYLDGGDGFGGASLTPAAGTTSSEIKTSGETTEERKVRFGASVEEREYSRDGGATTSSQFKMLKQDSKYDEDVFINGHSTVWGSFFHVGAFRWGYGDDHSLMKNSYCTGPNGRIANDDANEMRYGTGESGSAALAQAKDMLQAVPQGQRKGDAKSSLTNARSKHYGDADPTTVLDREKLQAALQKEEELNKTHTADERKRSYNSLKSSNDVTEEEMEAYRLKKSRTDDPMMQLADSGKLLEY